MSDSADRDLARVVAGGAQPLDGFGGDGDVDSLLERLGSARCVLLGEATHGTHEFYELRAQLTRRLIREKGFHAVAVEADWPDAYRVNRYVQGTGTDSGPLQALSDFRRFPTWMWRNFVVKEFVAWLRAYNGERAVGQKVGFYGLDLYSLHASIDAVLSYLDTVDPEAARRARFRYACFDHLGEDPQGYGYSASFGLTADCQKEVLQQLVELQRRRQELLRRDGFVAEDEYFQAEQNARLIKNAEAYYRSMFQGRSSWNLRDTHMADTLDALLVHFERREPGAKIVVWAHNSHVGNARATETGKRGEVSLGQLTRERHGAEAFLLGFTTTHGTVTAASEWDGPAERKNVRDALPGSYEDLFHATGKARFLLRPSRSPDITRALSGPRLHRAIGVIYRPESERVRHYFYSRLPEQYDAVIHVDRTRALEPLERTPAWDAELVPETYPTGL